jgi:hypothetical protein
MVTCFLFINIGLQEKVSKSGRKKIKITQIALYVQDNKKTARV